MFRRNQFEQMKPKKSNRLKQVELILTSISVSLKQLNKIEELPIYRIEIWLDRNVIDETADIIASIVKKQQTLVLTINSSSFKYKVADLFSLHKVARIDIKLLRSAIFSNEQQILDEYHIVLSQYSYEYLKSTANAFSQHSVGRIRRSFLSYNVRCSYQEQIENKQNNVLKEIPRLVKNENFSMDSSPNSKKQPKSIHNILALPLESRKDIQNHVDDFDDTHTYISRNRLQPVYRSDHISEANLRIKLMSNSQITMSPYNSEIEVQTQTQKLSKQVDSLASTIYLVYMIIALIRIIDLMFPNIKA